MKNFTLILLLACYARPAMAQPSVDTTTKGLKQKSHPPVGWLFNVTDTWF